MFENIGHFFKRMVKPEQKELGSKDAAKERLHLVLMQDRANVSADFLELMKQEIIDVIKKYIVVEESSIDVRLTNQSNDDGTNGAPALYANIPIVNIKNDMMAEKVKEFEGVDFNKEMGIYTPESQERSAEANETQNSNLENELNDVQNEDKELEVNEEENSSENIVNEEQEENNVEIEEKLNEESINKENTDNEEEKLDGENEELQDSNVDYVDDEDEEDDDVTFDDLLKAAEEEEKKSKKNK